jgi:hypothetical protein
MAVARSWTEQTGDNNMKILHHHIQWAAILRRVLSWMTETTAESRSARLSTLGLSSYGNDGDGFEHPRNGHHFR